MGLKRESKMIYCKNAKCTGLSIKKMINGSVVNVKKKIRMVKLNKLIF